MGSKMKRLATVNQMAELYPSFTQSAIRWLIFNEKINGFTKCLRRIGRRVLIDLDDFEHWIDMQQASGGAK